MASKHYESLDLTKSSTWWCGIVSISLENLNKRSIIDGTQLNMSSDNYIIKISRKWTKSLGIVELAWTLYTEHTIIPLCHSSIYATSS